MKAERKTADEQMSKLKSSIASASTDDEKNTLLKKLLELEENLTLKLKKESEKQNNHIKEKLAERRRKKQEQSSAIKEKYNSTRKAEHEKHREIEKRIKDKMYTEKLESIIERIQNDLPQDQLPFALEKLIHDKHINELSDLLTTQLEQKAMALQHFTQTQFDKKLNALTLLKQDMNNANNNLTLSLKNHEITQQQYQRKLLELEQKEKDKSKKLELLYFEEEAELEEKLSSQFEKSEAEELVQLKKNQLEEKMQIIDKYIPPNLQKEILLDDNEWLHREIANYREELEEVNSSKLEELEKEKDKILKLAEENEEEMKALDEQTHKLQEKLEEQNRRREEQQRIQLEKDVKGKEKELERKGITEEEKNKLLAEHMLELNALILEMDKERERQTGLMQEKLQAKLKEKELMRILKQQKLDIYKKEQQSKLDQKVSQLEIQQEQKIMVRQAEDEGKSKVYILAKKYDSNKTLFDKTKTMAGLQDIKDYRDLPPEQMLGLFSDEYTSDKKENKIEFSFDLLFERVKEMEQVVDNFTGNQFDGIARVFRDVDFSMTRIQEPLDPTRSNETRVYGQ